jgi:hypothetical protein
MKRTKTTNIALFAVSFCLIFSSGIVLAYPNLMTLVDVRRSIAFVESEGKIIETFDDTVLDEQTIERYRNENESLYRMFRFGFRATESFLNGDYRGYAEQISYFELENDFSKLDGVATAENKMAGLLTVELAGALVKIYTNVIAADFAQVNLEQFERVLKVPDHKGLTAENRAVAQAAFYYASGNLDDLFAVTQNEVTGSFNKAFCFYLISKLEGTVESSISALKLLDKYARQPSEKDPGQQDFLLGLANLYLVDVYSNLVVATRSAKAKQDGQMNQAQSDLVAKYAEEGFKAAALARSNINVLDYASFYGLAFTYTGQLLQAVYSRSDQKGEPGRGRDYRPTGKKDEEIKRAFEVGEMFR